MATRFWVGGTGTWDSAATTHWATTSGGASGASAPTATDDVVFDANSNVGTGSFSVTVAAPAPSCQDLTISGLDGAMTLVMSTQPLTITGNTSLPASNFAFSGTVALVFAPTAGTKTVTSGVNFTVDFFASGAGGVVQLAGPITSSRAVTHNAGNFDLNGQTVTATAYVGTGTTARQLQYNGGKFVLTGNAATVWDVRNATNWSFTGTSNNEFTYSGATGTRTIRHGDSGNSNEAMAVNFKISAGTDIITLTAAGLASSVLALDFTGFAGSLTNTGLGVYGNLTFSAGMTLNAGSNIWTLGNTSGTLVFTTNGKTVDFPLIYNGVGGTLQLADNLTLGATRNFTLTNGTLNLNGKTLSAQNFITAAGTKNLTWNGGTLAVTGSGATAFNNAQPTNFSTTAGTGRGVISMTNAAAKTFVGAGSNFHAKLNQGGAGDLTVTGSNTFTALSNTAAGSFLITAATTQTFTDATDFDLGTAFAFTLTSATAANHNLSLASGTVTVSNGAISRSQAAGGAAWRAPSSQGNVDNGNNSGWNFSPLSTGNFFMLFTA